MSKIDDLTRLRHMRDAAIEAISFVENCTREDLDRDRKLTLALVKDIEIIGEAAGRISDNCQSRSPQVPWSQIIGITIDPAKLDWQTISLGASRNSYPQFTPKNDLNTPKSAQLIESLY